NALHQMMKRLPSAAGDPQPTLDLLRGVFHGAISVYLDRFLNVPPARLPGERGGLDDEPADPAQLCNRFLDLLNTQGRVEEAARVTASYLSPSHLAQGHVAKGHPVEQFIAALARAVVREDANFHTFQ